MPTTKIIIQPSDRFNFWTVIEFSHYYRSRQNKNIPYYRVRCQCGNERTITGISLRRGSSKSCGKCGVTIGRATLTHGQANKGKKTPEYNTWVAMKHRCGNPKNKSYRYYGGRGIQVCDRWKHSFENFYTDMGLKPSPKHTIDRINNNGPYSPENCRWITRTEQCRNRRSNVVITWDGQTMCLTEWAEYLSISRAVLANRNAHGWSIERMLTTPVAGVSVLSE